jgi:hypothetical protein
MTFPGRYIAALPPSVTAGSTVDHCCVVRLSTLVGMGSRAVLPARTRPSGSRNVCG